MLRIEDIQKTYLIYASPCCSLLGTGALGNSVSVLAHWNLEWNELLVKNERTDIGETTSCFGYTHTWGNYSHTQLFMVYIITDFLNEILQIILKYLKSLYTFDGAFLLWGSCSNETE